MSDGTEQSERTEDAEPSDRPSADRDGDSPLSELAQRVSDSRRERASEAGDEVSADDGEVSAGDADPFEEMSVSEIDEETLWESLGEDADQEPELSVGADPVDEPETTGTARTSPEPREHVVSKESYCQKCPHLGDPPELQCTHDGTEIVEVVDSEHFRVRECPMVDE
ncbi:hypothetical protein [Halobellus litoreus]|uniref:DUF8135 domain-containing protein n=1 Tax=Halobellus litoreus TaxID=755310 RepID=A0ABD6DZF7_9EURY|nr:hypothetical protein [Halobellus litoreus]